MQEAAKDKLMKQLINDTLLEYYINKYSFEELQKANEQIRYHFTGHCFPPYLPARRG